MKKRLIALLATIIIAIPILAIPAARAQPRWTLIANASVNCYRSDNSYVATISADDTVYKMSMDIILYEKGLFTSYKEVSRISKTVNNYNHSAFGNYTYSSSKDYKIEMTVTVFSTSGQTETITVSNEYT